MTALGSAVPFLGQGIGTVLQMRAARDQAASDKQAAEFQATQLETQAGQEQAASQRASFDETRRATYAASRAQAVAAASGAGGGDKTVTDVIGRIAQEGAYRSSLALYQGDMEARQMKLRAFAVRQTGRAQESAWNTMSTVSALSGASSLYSKYGRNIPSSNSDMTPISDFTYSGYDASGGPAYG